MVYSGRNAGFLLGIGIAPTFFDFTLLDQRAPIRAVPSCTKNMVDTAEVGCVRASWVYPDRKVGRGRVVRENLGMLEYLKQ